VADLKIDANITAPKVVNIRLVRADLLDVATMFRVSFDVSLAVAMTIVGITIGAPGPVPKIQWAFLAFAGLAAVVSLALDVRTMRRALRNDD